MKRQDVEQLEKKEPMPLMMEAMLKKDEKTFITPDGLTTEEEAKIKLEEIKDLYHEVFGWRVLPGHEGVFKDDDGLWYAFRHQAQYTR